MPLEQALTSYFEGEKIEALVFIAPVGLLSLLFGAWLLVEAKEPFARGAAWPFVLLGLVLAGTGLGVGFRTASQVETLRSALAAGPGGLAEELARMAKVNAAWGKYIAMYVAFIAAAVALRFVLKSAFGHGVGAALFLFAGLGLLIDGFAQQRAETYTQALETARGQPGSGLAPIRPEDAQPAASPR